MLPVMVANWKPSREARKAADRKRRRERRTKETSAKVDAKQRDSWRCRFPLCGCRKAGLRLEASHDRHKGMGGDPSGERSTRDGLLTLCIVRHQTGAISRHKGTLRTRYLSDKKNDGPVAFEVDAVILMQQLPAGCITSMLTAVVVDALHKTEGWLELARESRVGVVEPLEPWQRRVLERLALLMDV